MKKISISESKMIEAMAQIDTLEGISEKNKGCLRLLTEEMFAMVQELLKAETMDFTVESNKGQYKLCVETKTRVNESVREQFLSMSSSGKNAANRGIKGLLGAVLEIFSCEGDPMLYSASIPYGMCTLRENYAYTWSLSQYMDIAPRETQTSDWDGMEKSIIANFADDVTIGVRSGKLEMIVTKTFQKQ